MQAKDRRGAAPPLHHNTAPCCILCCTTMHHHAAYCILWCTTMLHCCTKVETAQECFSKFFPTRKYFSATFLNAPTACQADCIRGGRLGFAELKENLSQKHQTQHELMHKTKDVLICKRLISISNGYCPLCAFLSF